MTEDDTPFKPSKTQTIFKNAANVTLRGNTFDATHLDRFLGSNFGERSLQAQIGNQMLNPVRSTVSARTGLGGGGGSNIMNYMGSGHSS